MGGSEEVEEQRYPEDRVCGQSLDVWFSPFQSWAVSGNANAEAVALVERSN